MRLFVASVCLAFFSIALTAPAHSDELADRIAAVPNPRLSNGWVADPAGVIARRTPEINGLLADLERETSAEVAVVVLPTIGRLVPKEFAVALFERWGVGKKEKDNGVLVLHVLDQRRIEIETGYGMEGILPDAKCRWIREEIAIPFFKKNSIADGHFETVRALVRAIEQPDISHQALISLPTIEPGSTVDRIPEFEARDSIELKYAGVPEKVFFNGWTPIVLLAIGVGVYLFFGAVYRSRAQGRSPYEQYNLYNGAAPLMQYAAAAPVAASAYVAEFANTGTFFAAAPVLFGMLFLTFWRRRGVLRALRDAPRTCECGKAMRRLSEDDDDAHITKGNVAEESIGSMEYDVWVCDCGKSSIETYKGRAFAKPCPKCNYKTFRETDRRVVTQATTLSTGLTIVTSACANCAYTDTRNEIIPRVTTSTSGSSSSGRSGGSFGGGRSGGGGGGSSY